MLSGQKLFLIVAAFVVFYFMLIPWQSRKSKDRDIKNISDPQEVDAANENYFVSNSEEWYLRKL